MYRSMVPMALWALLASCDSPGQAGEVSACGGFAGLGQALTAAGADDYCAAEVLLWEYDASAQSLSLANNRVLLNCCGNHSVTLEQTGDTTYRMTEVDAPEFGDARCGCMCVFDFTVTADNVPPGSIRLELNREVTDSSEPFLQAYAGALNLGDGAGTIVLDDTDLDVWCGGT